MDTPSTVSEEVWQESQRTASDSGAFKSKQSRTGLPSNDSGKHTVRLTDDEWTKETFVAALQRPGERKAEAQKRQLWTKATWVEALSTKSFASSTTNRDAADAAYWALQRNPNRLRCMPRSAADLLASRLIKVVVDLGMSNTWYAFAPSMLGQNTAVDFAARALILHHEPKSVQAIVPYEVPSYTAYRIALNHLRVSLDASDFSLMTTGLLGLYEMLRKDHLAALHTHAQGVSAVIKAHLAEGRPASPVVRAALYSNTVMTFARPLLMGVASPFDKPEWLELDPAAVQSLQTPIVKLSKIAHQIALRIPRLIAITRRLRQSAAPEIDTITNARLIADKIFALKDYSSEDELLRTVKLLPSTRPVGNPLDTDFFLFDSVPARDTMLMYWTARLIIVKLGLVLCDIQRRNDPLSDAQSSKIKLEHEQAGLLLCVLMCWNNGFGHVNVFNILWSALMGRKDVRGHDAQSIRTWIMWQHEAELSGWGFKYGPEHADVDADVLAGGPLEGSHLQWFREIGLIPSADRGGV